MPRYEWQRWFDRPVAVGGVQIGMAHPAGGDLDQHFVVGGFGHRNLLQLERSIEMGYNRSAHCLCHGRHPFSFGVLSAYRFERYE